MKTGEALKRFRKEFNLNQRTVAQVTGLLPQSYSRYESGQYPPTVPMLTALADTYGVTTDYLLGRSDAPYPAPDNAALINTMLECRDLIQRTLDNKVATK